MQNNDTKFNSESLEKASGAIGIRMTNDYLFRALMQRNNKVLKAFICSLLHLTMKSVCTVEIKNPIELGKHIDDKDFYLDIKVELDHHTVINLEMQVLNEGNWPERSLVYLCRSFDGLQKGEDYNEIKSAIHISILDFTLFPQYPEFFATYWMTNEKKHNIYSRKFRLSVLDLKQIELATEEDRKYKIDYWANLFKSTTWEELKMIAKSDEYIREAVDTVYQLSKEEQIRLQCEAREDYYRRMRRMEKLMEENKQLTAKYQQISTEHQQISAEYQQISTEHEQLQKENENMEAEIIRLKQLLCEQREK